jgi:hypothetical protein
MASEVDHDPRHHMQKMQQHLQETMDHLREDIEKTSVEGDVRDIGGSAGRSEEGILRL